jgi:AcrR family transcriptional regulator
VARPKKPLISLERVIEAATRILETEGIEALSLRNLSARMNVNSASLYHHFANKDEILLSVVRTALRDAQLPPLSDHWENWICENAVAYRRLLIKKPFLVPLILSGIRPHTMAYAISDAKLAETSIPDELRHEFLIMLDNAVIGSALISIKAPQFNGGVDHTFFDHEQLLRGTVKFMINDMVEQFRKGKRRTRRNGRPQPETPETPD